MLTIQKKISTYNFNNTNNPQYIVIHDVGADGTAKENVDYFSGGNRGASAHCFVDDDSIWQSVEFNHGAWHCGDNNGYGRFAFGITNSNSIGIEMCLPSGNVTEKTEANTIELVKYLMSKYNIPASKVVRHYDASRKNCPATFNINNWERWFKFKAKLENKNVAIGNKIDYSKYATYVGNRCKELQEKLIKCGYDCGGYGADGKFGAGTYNSLVKFQKDYGLVVDGLAGDKTFKKLDELSVVKNSSYTVKITADVLNVRKGPGTNYAVSTTVKQNDVYTIVDENNGFGKLLSGAGWISLSYTKKM